MWFLLLSFLGMGIFFNQTVKTLKNRNVLTLAFVYLLIAMTFSRISSSSIFNGENIISRIFFLSGLIIFSITVIYTSIKYPNGCKKLKFEYLFFIIFYLLCLFSARSAVRLIMVLSTVVAIPVAYLNYFIWGVYKNQSGKEKIFWLIIGVIISLITLGYFIGFYQEISYQAYCNFNTWTRCA